MSPTIASGVAEGAGDGSPDGPGEPSDGAGVGDADGGARDGRGEPATLLQAETMRESAAITSRIRRVVLVFMTPETLDAPGCTAGVGHPTPATHAEARSFPITLTTISGRPVTTSHAGRTTTASSGRIVGSPIISSPMNSASQPLRVTATSTPT